MNEFPLGELLEELIDHRGKTPKKLGGDFSQEGVPVVSAIHIKDGRIDWSQRARFVDEAMYERWMPIKLRRGDVLLTSEAPLGQVAQVPDNEPLVLSQRLFALRGKEGVLDSTYLRYFLQTRQGQAKLRAQQSGSTVEGIQQARLRKVLIPVPRFEEQKRIASVLSSFDALIETDRRLIADVLELTRVAYKQVSIETSELVPLGSLATVNPEKRSPGIESEQISYVDIGVLGDGSVGEPPKVSWRDAPSRARRGAQLGDVLWATVRPNRRGHGMLTHSIPNLVVSTGIAVLRAISVPPSLLFAMTDEQGFVDLLCGRVDGSAYPAVRADDFLAIEVPNVSTSGIQLFEKAIEPMWLAVGALEQEIKELTQKRDELLPLLMSGQVRVSEAETLVS